MINKSIILIVLLSLFGFDNANELHSQVLVHYQEKIKMKSSAKVNINSEDSQVPIDLSNLMNQLGAMSTQYELSVFDNRSIYKKMDKPEDENFSSKVKFEKGNEVLYTFIDRGRDELIISEVFFGKTINVQDSTNENCWEFIQQDTIISGYLCQKAILEEPPYFTTTAYYTEEIPISAGPYIYYDLPGLILRLERGNTVIKADKINFNKAQPIQRPTNEDDSSITLSELIKIKNQKIQERRKK